MWLFRSADDIPTVRVLLVLQSMQKEDRHYGRMIAQLFGMEDCKGSWDSEIWFTHRWGEITLNLPAERASSKIVATITGNKDMQYHPSTCSGSVRIVVRALGHMTGRFTNVMRLRTSMVNTDAVLFVGKNEHRARQYMMRMFPALEYGRVWGCIDSTFDAPHKSFYRKAFDPQAPKEAPSWRPISNSREDDMSFMLSVLGAEVLKAREQKLIVSDPPRNPHGSAADTVGAGIFQSFLDTFVALGNTIQYVTTSKTEGNRLDRDSGKATSSLLNDGEFNDLTSSSTSLAAA